ncbi:hypothetical protein GCM10020220_020680 [Nonomuraea rubra]|uniref:hypothetical protein n=1 Tax=Nonomuraea rubra TaxID=46180 RepID=UPI0031E761A0
MDAHVLLRVHLTPGNLDVMPAFLTQVRDTFLDDRRFRVFLKRVVRLGGAGDASMEVLDAEDERIAALEEIVVSGRAGREPVRGGAGVLRRPCQLDDGAGGRAARQVHRRPVRTRQHRRAPAPDGTLEVDTPRFRRWLQGWESRDAELTACPYEAFTGRALSCSS